MEFFTKGHLKMAAQGIAIGTLTVPNAQSATAPQSVASASAPNASSALSGAPASSTTTPSNPSASPTSNQKSKSRAQELLKITWQYKWQGLLGLVVSIIALRYAIRADALATWTGKKDFREGCFADMDRNITSPDCLVAISNVLPPPVRKRDVEAHKSSWHTTILWAVYQVASICLFGVFLIKKRVFIEWLFGTLIVRGLSRHLHRKVPRGSRLLDPPGWNTPEPVTRQAERKSAIPINNPGLRQRRGNMRLTTQELFNAVRDKNYGQVKYILSCGADPNAEFGDCTQNLLLEAVHTNNYPIIQLLLDHGANPTLEITLKPILHLAMSESNVFGVEHLINAGADLNATGGEHAETSIHIACRNGWPSLRAAWRLVTIFFVATIFVVSMTVVSEARLVEIFAAGAAYAAVLVVFVSGNGIQQN
ncbi:uncharacterized protein PAC_10232 [Phialocephala subalpina]|uniref:Uncharacterized protein n=1 Tax=Phialocephala subalpina TaxID=576137 RepID=A0A1L7X5M6_9HELO|nr:uncharacterized protein PAC_10232 [Phialocephala subalpina]